MDDFLDIFVWLQPMDGLSVTPVRRSDGQVILKLSMTCGAESITIDVFKPENREEAKSGLRTAYLKLLEWRTSNYIRHQDIRQGSQLRLP